MRTFTATALKALMGLTRSTLMAISRALLTCTPGMPPPYWRQVRVTLFEIPVKLWITLALTVWNALRCVPPVIRFARPRSLDAPAMTAQPKILAWILLSRISSGSQMCSGESGGQLGSLTLNPPTALPVIA